MPDDELRLLVPADGRGPRVRNLDDAVDLAFLSQTPSDAIVACLDHHRRVVLVAETDPCHLPRMPGLLAELPEVAAAVVLTADEVTEVAREDDLLAWQRLDGEFARCGLLLVDWVHVDELLVRSMAETAEGEMRWSQAG